MQALAHRLATAPSRLFRTHKQPSVSPAALVATRHASFRASLPSEASGSSNSLTSSEAEEREVDAFLEAMQQSGEFPNLMQPDPLMDLHQRVNFPPSKHTPFENQVIVRNEPSMFLALQEILKKSAAENNRPFVQGGPEGDKTNPLKFLHLSIAELNNLHRYPLVLHRVTQQTGKGKIYRYSSLTVVGNGNGLVGYGEAKDEEGARAVSKALIAAVRNMDYIERFEQRTLYTEMESKFGSTRLILRPRPIGFGLHCNPNIHQVFKAAGIKDASAKVWGSRKPKMVIKGLFKMLHPSHAPTGMGNGIGGPARRLNKGSGIRTKEEVERERGRQLVSLRTW